MDEAGREDDQEGTVMETLPACAQCPYKVMERGCVTEGGKHPPSCPTQDRPDLVERSLREYEKPGILEFAKQATVQEAEAQTSLFEADDLLLKEIASVNLNTTTPIDALNLINRWQKELKSTE